MEQNRTESFKSNNIPRITLQDDLHPFIPNPHNTSTSKAPQIPTRTQSSTHSALSSPCLARNPQDLLAPCISKSPNSVQPNKSNIKACQSSFPFLADLPSFRCNVLVYDHSRSRTLVCVCFLRPVDDLLLIPRSLWANWPTQLSSPVDLAPIRGCSCRAPQRSRLTFRLAFLETSSRCGLLFWVLPEDREIECEFRWKVRGSGAEKVTEK